jgi:hypothetical protein
VKLKIADDAIGTTLLIGRIPLLHIVATTTPTAKAVLEITIVKALLDITIRIVIRTDPAGKLYNNDEHL